MNTGDTAWVLASAALVLVMTPGLAFFYGGMVRSKNVLNMLMMNYITIGVVGVVWVLVGYTLAFGDGGKFIGDFSHIGLKDTIGQLTGADGHQIPVLAFVMFQAMFAIITPALFTGSIADRIKFAPFIVIVAVWSVLVYAPIAHWVWSANGWLFSLGAEDFALQFYSSGTTGLPWCSASARAGARTRCGRTTCRSSCSVPACCGSAGSGSTPARPWLPTTRPLSPSRRPTPRRPRP